MPRTFRLLVLCLTALPALFSQGVITTIAGTDVTYANSSYSAFSASFGTLTGVAVSPSGDIYFASQSRSLVVRFNPQRNSVVIVAGTGTAGYSGDGGPAVNAALQSPQGLAFDHAGNLYIADQLNNCIRKIDTQGIITTYASGLNESQGVTVAADGSVYATDLHRVLRLDGNGSYTVIAGQLQPGFAGDNQPASQALLYGPKGLAFDSDGNLYVAEVQNRRIRRIAASPSGTISRDSIITTFAGNGGQTDPVDGQPATATSFAFPVSIAFDAQGNAYVGSNAALVRINSKGIVSLLTPGPAMLTDPTTPRPVATAFVWGQFLAFDPSGNLYLTDFISSSLCRLSPSGIVQTVAAYSPGFGLGDGGPALSAGLSLAGTGSPGGVALMPNGSLLIADTFNHRIRSISPASIISTVAGNGVPAYPNAGSALSQPFLDPQFVVSDQSGGFYVSSCNYVAHVNSSGATSRLALAGVCAGGLAVDTQGNLLVVDDAHNQILSVSPAGKATVIAGNGNAGFSGDNGPATSASMNSPQGIAVDANGVVYFADQGNNRIRKFTPGGTIITLAVGPNGATQQSNGSDGLNGIALDRQGNLYVTAQYHNFAAKVSPDGVLTPITGASQLSRVVSGDGGLATAASLYAPTGIAVDNAGNIYIADSGTNRIRKILATPVSFAIATTNVDLSAVSRGPSVSANIGVTSSVQGLMYSLGFTTATGGDWLDVGSVLQGTAPGILTINADPSGLQPGTYSGTVTLTSPLASPSTLTISITLQVGASQSSKLSLNTTSLAFAFTAGNGPASQQLTVSNAGAGVSFTATAATSSGGSWLQVSSATGTTSAASPSTLTVTATPGTLPPATYSGTVTIASASTGDQLVVQVSMAISAAQQRILLSQAGLTFTAVSQGGPVLAQNFGILNAGAGAMNWTAKASTLSGGDWLGLLETSGTVTTPLLDVSFVDVQVNAQSLAAGNYYGTIQVTAPGAANSPQTITVVLNVLLPRSNPGPEVRPSGLVFTGINGGNNPGSQSVNVSNVAGMKQLTYGSSATYVNGNNWLSYLPANATLDSANSQRIVVQPDFSSLSPDIYRGAITLALTDGSIRTVSILSVVAPGTAGGASQSSPLAARAACAPTGLQMQVANPQQVFTASFSQPVSLELQVVDNCGAPVTPKQGASVAASFSTGDPQLAMVHTQNGRWSGTWVPRNGAAGSNAQITITAFSSSANAQVLTSQISLTANLAAGPGAPVPLKVQNAASFAETAVVAPGALISLFGSGLAGTPASGSVPLPTGLAGSEVTLGGQALPLLYASDGQVNAQVPYSLALNTQLQLQIKHGNLLSVPEQLTVAPAQPAIFTADQSGHGQGSIVKSDGITLAQPGTPASIGEVVVIYCTGLGPVTPTIAEGVPPSGPPNLSAAVNPVTVTIGGQPADVIFSGLTPGDPGLYQINVVVPSGIQTGDSVAVVISAAGQTSPAVTMAVK